MAHHDVAIVENPNLPPPSKNWELFGAPQAAIVCGVPEFIREISTDNVREDRYGREYCK